MKLVVVAAGFTPGEADQLRRAMGAWKRTWRHQPVRAEADRRHAGQRLHGGIRPQPFRADRRLRLVWLPGIARGVVRPAGLCLGLDQVPSSRGVPGRPFEQPADGFLRAGTARGRRSPPWCRGPSRRCQSERLRLHARASRGRRQAGRAARLDDRQGTCRAARPRRWSTSGKPDHSPRTATSSHARASRRRFCRDWRRPMRSARSVSHAGRRSGCRWPHARQNHCLPVLPTKIRRRLPRLSAAEEVIHDYHRPGIIAAGPPVCSVAQPFWIRKRSCPSRRCKT